MKRPGCIVINAFDRGGSNILWNIMRSHPEIVAPVMETNQIFSEHVFPNAPVLRPLVRNAPRFAVAPLHGYVRDKLNKLKLTGHDDLQGVEHGRSALRGERDRGAPIVCFKSVDRDIAYSRLLEDLFGGARFICLVRDGYALCEGWMRRKQTAAEAGRKFAIGVTRMLALCESPNATMVKFEDMVREPFATAERLYAFCGLEPASLPKLRLRAKRVVSAGGGYEAAFGVEGEKRWFSPSEIVEVLDPGVGDRQTARLSDGDRRAFDAHAGEAMRKLGYA